MKLIFKTFFALFLVCGLFTQIQADRVARGMFGGALGGALIGGAAGGGRGAAIGAGVGAGIGLAAGAAAEERARQREYYNGRSYGYDDYPDYDDQSDIEYVPIRRSYTTNRPRVMQQRIVQPRNQEILYVD